MAESAHTFFNRHGDKLAAVFALPDAAPKAVPAVLLCQGISGLKDLVLPDVAARLAAKGFASLRFDYTGFGESEGAAGWMDPPERVHDARFAFAWLRARPEIDEMRLGVYGHSYGGPVAVCLAAREPRARAVVAVSGLGGGDAMLTASRTSWDWIALKKRVAEARATAAETGDSAEMDLGELFPFSPESVASYGALKEAAGATGTMSGADAPKFRLSSIDAMRDFHPEDEARRLEGRPLLLVHGENDDVAPIETVEPIFANAPGPKRWEIIPGAGHTDLDAGPTFEHAVDLAAAWFSEHLA